MCICLPDSIIFFCFLNYGCFVKKLQHYILCSIYIFHKKTFKSFEMVLIRIIKSNIIYLISLLWLRVQLALQTFWLLYTVQELDWWYILFTYPAGFQMLRPLRRREEMQRDPTETKSWKPLYSNAYVITLFFMKTSDE